MESMGQNVSVSGNRNDDFYYLPEPANPKSLEELAGVWIDDHPVCIERLADPSGVEAARQIFGAWADEEDSEDMERMIQAIRENRTLEREVKI